MPTKHIPEHTWKKVEKELVRAVIATQMPMKDTDMLNLLIIKGLENITEDDYKRYNTARKQS
jgi:hypothetical protein